MRQGAWQIPFFFFLMLFLMIPECVFLNMKTTMHWDFCVEVCVQCVWKQRNDLNCLCFVWSVKNYHETGCFIYTQSSFFLFFIFKKYISHYSGTLFFFKTWRQLCTVISLLKFGQCVWQSALACWKKLTGTYLEVQLLWTFKLSSPSYLICTQLTEMVSAFLRTKKEKKYAKHGVNQIRGCGLSRFYLPCMDLHPRW